MPSGSSLSAPTVVNGTGQLKPAPKIITESLTLVYPPIIRDYILEIAVLVVGANSKVGGLREVCALAALILGVDCMLLCTYLAAILGVMIEVSLSPPPSTRRAFSFRERHVYASLFIIHSLGPRWLFLTSPYCQRGLDPDITDWGLSRGRCADPKCGPCRSFFFVAFLLSFLLILYRTKSNHLFCGF